MVIDFGGGGLWHLGNVPWHFMISRPILSCSHWWEFVYRECCHDISATKQRLFIFCDEICVLIQLVLMLFVVSNHWIIIQDDVQTNWDYLGIYIDMR